MRRFQHIGTSRREGTTGQAAGAAVAVTQGTGGNAVATVTSSEMVATDFEENVVRISSPSKALTISAWYRGVELRMKTMGQLVPQYQKKNRPDDGGNFVQYNYGRAGVINYKLQVRPNPIMTATTFWQQVEYLRIMTGNALVYIERDGSGEAFDVRNLWLCNGGVYNEQTGTYDLWYLSDRGQRFVSDIDREDVLHFANTFKFPGTIWGIPTLTFAIQTLSLQATNNRQAMENAAKGGRVKLILREGGESGESVTSSRARQKKMKGYCIL